MIAVKVGVGAWWAATNKGLMIIIALKACNPNLSFDFKNNTKGCNLEIKNNNFSLVIVKISIKFGLSILDLPF